jgi:glycosyltransferase involved in cell wall biosynthesis
MASFIRNDLKILKEHFVVYPVCISFNVLKALLSLIFSISKADVIFVWFAGFQAFISVFIAKFFCKKLVIVAGGYDAAYVPEINYGVFTCWWRAIMAIFAYRNADLVLAVSKYTKKELLRYVAPKKLLVIYNGVDTETFVLSVKKQKYVLTVGAVNKSNLKKKGLKTFVEAAKFLPDISFTLVGSYADNSIDYLKRIASKNVTFTGYVSFKELLELYKGAMVYAQLSYHESFGVALAEAMACGCIPLITRRGALPEVAGECGIYVPYGDSKATAKAVLKAFKRKELVKCARDRIVRIFSLEKRKKKLMEALVCLFN